MILVLCHSQIFGLEDRVSGEDRLGSKGQATLSFSCDKALVNLLTGPLNRNDSSDKARFLLERNCYRLLETWLSNVR